MVKKSIDVGRLQITEIKVYPKIGSEHAVTIKIEPAIEGEALEALLASTNVEINKGKLVSFK